MENKSGTKSFQQIKELIQKMVVDKFGGTKTCCSTSQTAQ